MNKLSLILLFLPAIAYCWTGYFEIPAGSEQIILTVPENRQFIIKQLYVYSGTEKNNPEPWHSTNWQLLDAGNILIDGSVNLAGDFYGVGGAGTHYTFHHDFPDGCVSVQAGSQLKALNTCGDNRYKLYLTLIGYFTETEIEPANPDLNSDGKINFFDFAIFADNWLK